MASTLPHMLCEAALPGLLQYDLIYMYGTQQCSIGHVTAPCRPPSLTCCVEKVDAPADDEVEDLGGCMGV